MENIFFGIPFKSDFQLSVENQKRLAYLLFTSPTTTAEDAKQIVDNQNLISKVDLLINNLQCELYAVSSGEDNNSYGAEAFCKKKFDDDIIPKIYDWTKTFAMPTDEELEVVLAEFKVTKSEFNISYRKHRALKLNSSAEIAAYLSESIKGQDEAVSVMAMAIENYKLRSSNYGIPQVSPLFVGSTGSGKTLLVKQASDVLSTPMVSINLGSTVPEGYVGRTTISKLLRDAFKQTESERYVIHLEELDKIATKYHKNDDYKPSIQNELLSLFDGDIKLFKGSEQHDTEKSFTINTKNCLIVASGCFDGIEEIIYNRILKEFMGNKSLIDTQAILSYNIALDFQKYGIISEITSRLSFVSFLKKLDVNALYHIMTESCDSDLKMNINWLKKLGVEIKITEKAIWEIAQHVYNLNVGARAISTFVTQVFQQILVQPDKYKQFVIDEQYVNYILDNKKYRQLFNQFQTQKPDLIKISESLSLNIDFVLDNYFLYKQFNH